MEYCGLSDVVFQRLETHVLFGVTRGNQLLAWFGAGHLKRINLHSTLCAADFVKLIPVLIQTKYIETIS